VDARHRPEAPGHAPGASSWAQRFNRDTVEWLAAYCRIAAMVCSAAYAVLFVVAAVVLAWGWALAAAAALLCTAGFAWLGFFYLANAEWKETKDG
jgi:hypothetical protein